MASKKAYTAPNAVIESLLITNVMFGSENDNLGADEDWSKYTLSGGQM